MPMWPASRCVCRHHKYLPTYLTYIQCLRRRLTERQPASPQRYLSYVQKPVLDDETDPVQLYFGHTSIHVYVWAKIYPTHDHHDHQKQQQHLTSLVSQVKSPVIGSSDSKPQYSSHSVSQEAFTPPSSSATLGLGSFLDFPFSFPLRWCLLIAKNSSVPCIYRDSFTRRSLNTNDVIHWFWTFTISIIDPQICTINFVIQSGKRENRWNGARGDYYRRRRFNAIGNYYYYIIHLYASMLTNHNYYRPRWGMSHWII